MKKNISISISKDVYLKAVEDVKAVYDYLFKEKPVFVAPDRAAFVAYEALTQITGEPINNDDFDREFYAAIRRDSCPDNMEDKIQFIMGWFCSYLGVEIYEEE